MDFVRKHSVFAVEDVDDEERKGDQCGQLQRRPYLRGGEPRLAESLASQYGV
jgi:hypothetical protein